MSYLNAIKGNLNFFLNRIIPFILVTNVFLIYGQLINHSYINFDDPGYVFENAVVRAGLTRQGMLWALTTTHMGNWHPMTWFSHMLDVELFGLSAGAHHLVNAFLHASNSGLLFLILLRTTGRSWESGLVAVLFAIHPLHVESVAWIAERKDTLSAFFWFASIYAYSIYVKNGKMITYLLTLLLYTLGLMSKSMVVTLPFILFLLDHWPLGRWRATLRYREGNGQAKDGKCTGLLIAEKIPFLLLSLGSSVITFVAQRGGGGIPPGDLFPLGLRFGNAIVSYVKYLTMAVMPVSLSVFYPHPLNLPVWKVAGSSVILATGCFMSICLARRRPYFAVGWAWYLGTMVPVIGVIQIGGQELADRYTYIPLIGIYIVVVWAISDLVSRWDKIKYVMGILASASVLILVLAARNQASYWRDSVTLFTHAIESTSSNALAHLHLGVALDHGGRSEESIAHYRDALGINPNYLHARYNLGRALQRLGRVEESLTNYSEALRIDPELVDARNNMGILLAQQGRYEEAVIQFREVLRLNPGHTPAKSNLEIALRSMNRKK